MEIKKGNNSFYLEESKIIGEITYIVDENNNFVVNHTYVDPEYRGNNYALLLVEKMIEYARSEGKKIIPVCPYVAKVMQRNEKYHDVWLKDAN